MKSHSIGHMPKITYNQPFTAPDDPLVSATDFYTVLEETLGGLLDRSYEPQDLLTADMRHRVTDLTMKLDALIKSEGISLGLVADMIKAAHAELQMKMSQLQTNGDWHVTAFKVTVSRLERRARSRSEKAQIAKAQAYDVLRSEGAPKPDKSVMRTIKENVVTIEFVFSDLAKMQEVDVWGERTGRTDGTLYGGRIPPKLVKQYEHARTIIRQMYDLDEGPREIDPQRRDDIMMMHGKGVPLHVIARTTKLDEALVESYIAEVSDGA
jgi:hypothetical protein